MRGKGPKNRQIILSDRITPACAGKSFLYIQSHRRCEDHPRVCGEKHPTRRLNSTLIGSPPHVRGKVQCLGDPAYLLRITPACAGKRSMAADQCCQNWDHPRMCGEKIVCKIRCNGCPGSPPHVRGKVSTVTADSKLSRITPACAGKS